MSHARGPSSSPIGMSMPTIVKIEMQPWDHFDGVFGCHDPSGLASVDSDEVVCHPLVVTPSRDRV